MSGSPRVMLDALLDLIKSDGFSYPLAELEQERWIMLRKNEKFKHRMVKLGRQQLQIQILRLIRQRFRPIKVADTHFEFSIQGGVYQRSVLLQIRDPRFNKVEQASQSLEASNALEAVAGALYDEDECRFEHWAKEIFGKLVDLAYDIDLEKERRKTAEAVQRLIDLRNRPILPPHLAHRRLPHPHSNITIPEFIRRFSDAQ